MFIPTVLFEGVDGSGKSTALSRLRSFLEQLKIPVTVVDSIAFSTFLEAHNKDWYDLAPTNTKYMQFLAYEVNSFYRKIEPQLGKSVILIDRYLPSCYAYNGLVEDENTPALSAVMDTLCKTFFRPDITFVFDVPDNILQARLNVTEQPAWAKDFKKITQIRQRYQEFFKKYSWNMFFLDGNLPLIKNLCDMLLLLEPILTLSPRAYTQSLSIGDKGSL